MEIFTIAGALGFIGFLAGLWRLQLKEHRSIVMCDIPICALWAVHYILLGGISGFIINALSVFRAIARCYMGKRSYFLITYIIMAIIWVLCLYFYSDWHSLLPPLASTIFTYGMLKSCRRTLTNCIIIHNLLWVIYGMALLSPMSCLSPAAGIIACFVGKIRHEGFGQIYIQRLQPFYTKLFARNR
jgi:hypothetical protein